MVSAVAPAGAVSILGLHLGAYGRRLAAKPSDRLAGLPVEPDARLLSATAELVSDLSAALGVLVGVATGWLVVAAAVRVAATAG